MKKITLIIFGLAIVHNLGMAAPSKTPQWADTSKSSKFVRLESVPGYKIKLDLSANQECFVDGKLNTQQFESEETRVSEETGKPTSVRIISLYVQNRPHCKGDSKSRVTFTYEVEDDAKRMTHLYLTYENPIQLDNVQTVK